MIAAVCANPCVDRTVSIDKFTYGGMNRIKAIHEDGSGKGVNVALACAKLGLQASCIGLMPRERNELILERLSSGGCQSEFVEYEGAVRINTKVVDLSAGIVTEFNESGPAVSEGQAQEMVEAAARWAARCSHIVLTGSAAPGCPADIYRRMIEAVKKAAPECSVVLDSEGKRLSEGLKAAPHIVKPNRYELELLCGRSLPGIADVHAEAMKLIGQGVRLAAVSLGADGAYMTDGKEALFAPALAVEVGSTVGAGDSFVAGLLYGLVSAKNLEYVFRCAVAAATSSLAAEGTSLVDVELFNEYLPRIDVRRVM